MVYRIINNNGVKKIWGSMVAAVLVITVMLSSAACGNANASKLEELDGMVTENEGIIADAQAQVDMLTGYVQPYEIESSDESYAQIAATMEGLAAQRNEIVGANNENRDSYTSEKVDELIAILGPYIETANTFLSDLTDTVS